MKKLIAILLTLVMLFALSATAMADMQTLSWITARRGIGMTDLTGKFYQIEDYDIDIWIPDNFELQEDIPDYCYCVFATEVSFRIGLPSLMASSGLTASMRWFMKMLTKTLFRF